MDVHPPVVWLRCCADSLPPATRLPASQHVWPRWLFYSEVLERDLFSPVRLAGGWPALPHITCLLTCLPTAERFWSATSSCQRGWPETVLTLSYSEFVLANCRGGAGARLLHVLAGGQGVWAGEVQAVWEVWRVQLCKVWRVQLCEVRRVQLCEAQRCVRFGACSCVRLSAV